MKKRILTLGLAIMLCLSLATMTAFTANSNEYISLDKEDYTAGQTIFVSTRNITEQMAQDEAFVAIYVKDSLHSSWGEYHHPKAGTDTLTFTAPKNGSYEMRLYSKDHQSDYSAVYVTSVPFSVGGSASTSDTVDNTIIRYPTKSDFDWNLIKFTTGIFYFTGTFETNWGTLSMIQKDNTVTGNYPHDKGKIEGTVSDGVLYGYWREANSYNPPNDAGQIVFVMNEDGKNFTGWWRYGNSGSWMIWSSGSRNVQASSSWASEEIALADALGLIPDSLKGADLKKPITRAEFAAVSVKTYEVLSGAVATPSANNPFTDTKDVEVLKAYNVGITAGTSADKFSPETLLNREQAATMLTRVIKKVTLTGWTLNDDSKFTLPYDMPATFADDKDISTWARDSVYFMAANGIITGTGNNNFSPKAVTDEQKAIGYAQATREQALLIAARMVEKLDK